MSNLEFIYSQTNLNNLADDILTKCKKFGATSAQLELNESINTNLEILNNNIESFETSYDNQLLLSVYVGQKKGNIGISELNPKNIDYSIKQAIDIANFTQADPASGLLEDNYLANSFSKDLNLYNPCDLPNESLIQKARTIEAMAIALDPNIIKSNGAGISLSNSNFILANTNGFNSGYQISHYALSLSLINHSAMQNDSWYSSTRDFKDLISNLDLAQITADRLKRRLKKGKLPIASPKIIFEAPIAKAIINSVMNAISGNSQYRKLSFLNDCLHQQILPEWITIHEDPFIYKGTSSCYFDNEGSKVFKRDIISNGIVNNYLMSSYSARKLKMEPTGNSGGNHNLFVSSNFDGNLNKLCQAMQTGLIVIETIGHGLNSVTGDYSVGASGLWVENGEIQFFVEELTISGNMKNIYKQILLIGNDYLPGSIECGSMLINEGVINVSSN